MSRIPPISLHLPPVRAHGHTSYSKLMIYTDRLPTISASQALQNAASRKLGISTSLPNLDQAFRSSFAMSSSKGLPRGQLTEVYGPPGVGKTAFAMQLASNALHEGDCVVWIDTGAPMPGPRFEKILKSHHVPAGQNPPSSPPVARSIQDLLEHFTYLSLRTLPHLLVMFLHPTAKFPPEKTALIVIDNVSSPFATAFLRSSDAKISTLDVARKHRLQWAANRKWAVAGDLASAMNKMAALKNMAIVVINQVATSLKGVKRAMLKPAISGAAWETAIHNQVVLWRDFAPGGSALDLSTASSVRLAEVVKAGGKIKPINSEAAVPFIVGKVC